MKEMQIWTADKNHEASVLNVRTKPRESGDSRQRAALTSKSSFGIYITFFGELVLCFGVH